MQPNNNRPPDEAEDHADDAIDGAFKPGDSFSNDPSDQGGSGELPSWLQNFADVAGESGSGQPEGATAPGEHAVTPPAAVPAPEARRNSRAPTRPGGTAAPEVASCPASAWDHRRSLAQGTPAAQARAPLQPLPAPPHGGPDLQQTRCRP